MFPAFLCSLIVAIQLMIDSQLNNYKYQCGCKCVDTSGSGRCQNICGIVFSTSTQAVACPIQRPQEWPALLQIPRPMHRAVKTDLLSVQDLPNNSCLKAQSCPVTSFFTGQNRSVANSLVRKLIINAFPMTATDLLDPVSLFILGTDSVPGPTNFIEQAFLSDSAISVLLPLCSRNFSFHIPIQMGNATFRREIRCVKNSYLWRDNSLLVNKELFQGYRGGNSANEINEVLGAYDFLNTHESNFNVSVWYNSTYNSAGPRLLRIPRSLNLVSNAFLLHFRGRGILILLDFVKEMPKSGTRITLDLSSLLGPLLFAWVIQLLFPVLLISLVHEKQHKLRIMMKLHGLGDRPYLVVSYGYFLVISSIYMIWFAVFGYIIGLKIFQLNNYGIQFIFYLLYLNVQIALSFLAATIFSKVKTATVVGYLYVFGSGLMGDFLFKRYIEAATFPRWHVIAMELLPGFSLYRGLYEFSQYALAGQYQATAGMCWADLNDKNNGMKEILILMPLEWLVFLCVSCYLDQIIASGNGVSRHPLFFIRKFWKTGTKPFGSLSCNRRSTVFVDLDKPDIFRERNVVQQILREPNRNYPVVCQNLRKLYPAKDGNSRKQAVQSFSLVVPRGECFGVLGPNGSGKTTVINMLTGFLPPTSGTAFIDSLDIRTEMNQIYTRIGVCPQHDLLWETLTGREHLLFYARLKNFKGAALKHVVEESLKSLNLFKGNVGDQVAGKYSGGMKRRLSVAISLIGDPQVVYMDEPTTGLDPDSRNFLWHVLKRAKKDRAIILTTHSMEEAEFLCDRLGIIVDGRLECLGGSKELKTRYGGSYLLIISTNEAHEKDVEHMVYSLSPNAEKTYNIAGTQKFRLPKQEVRISDVFQAVKNARNAFNVYAFELADSSLEDVFYNVVRQARRTP